MNLSVDLMMLGEQRLHLAQDRDDLLVPVSLVADQILLHFVQRLFYLLLIIVDVGIGDVLVEAEDAVEEADFDHGHGWVNGRLQMTLVLILGMTLNSRALPTRISSSR
jgi:hypothetical protein